MKERTIIGIDPGKSGGIAVYGKRKIQAVAMPEDFDGLKDYLQYVYDTYENIYVFFEKVQAYISDDEEPGKKFGINKMLANQKEVITVLRMIGFKNVIEVYPISWQTTLELKKKGEETKTERKNRFKTYAQNCFPEITITLKTADAVLLVQFGLYKFANDIDWIYKRLNNSNQLKAF